MNYSPSSEEALEIKSDLQESQFPLKDRNKKPLQNRYPSFQQADSSAQIIPPFNSHPQPSHPVPQDHPMVQSQISVPTDNEYAKLDNGWYYCYRIILKTYVVLTILYNIAIIAGIIVAWSDLTKFTKYKPYTGIFLINIITNQIFLIFISVQLRSMKERNLKKAKVAMIGFVIYLAVYIGYAAIIAIRIDELALAQILIQGCILLTIFYLLVGSICVFKFIKKIQNPDNKYQALNDESQHLTSA